MAENNSPTLADVERLFALSGNRCAFPKGPAEIQERLAVQSEVFRLLEDNEGMVAEGLKIARARALKFFERFGRSEDDLIRSKEEEKRKIIREILKLKRKKEKQ